MPRRTKKTVQITKPNEKNSNSDRRSSNSNNNNERVNKFAKQQPRHTSSGGNVPHSTLPAYGQRLLALNALLSVAIK